MSMPNINEGRLILVILIDFLMVSITLSCPERKIIRIGISEYDKKQILEMHNKYRQTVALGLSPGQPPAQNMMEMTWDDELAYGAQKWATSCSSTNRYNPHDLSRHLSRYLVGQNLALIQTTKHPSSNDDIMPKFHNDALKKWFNEVRRYHYGRFSGGSIGHYTQMVWAQTSAIGCGFALFWDPSGRYMKNYVCNYGPSGNVEGQLPYLQGNPNCQAYGLQYSRRYYGLCTGVSPNQNYDDYYKIDVITLK